MKNMFHKQRNNGQRTTTHEFYVNAHQIVIYLRFSQIQRNANVFTIKDNLSPFFRNCLYRHYINGLQDYSFILNYNNPKISKYFKLMHMENIFNYIKFF